jgi:hypothetical protein
MMMMNTTEIADRLARIENLILGLNKDALPLDGCVKKMPASRPEVEPQTQVCKVSYDVLAINIKNKLQKLFQTKELEVTWLEEIDFEDMILSSLNPIECNELITGSHEQVGLQNWTRCDTTVEKSSGMSVVNEDENSQSSTTTTTTTTTKPTKSKKTPNTSQTIDKESLKAEKEAKANEKKSEKQELISMKAADKESKEYETSIKKMEKATAPKPTETAAQKKKAEKEAKELEKKAEKEANELKKKAEKEAKELEKKAEKEANELKKKAEKEAKELEKKAEKENKAPRKRTKDATASQSLVSQSQPVMSQTTIELFHDDEVSNSKSSTTDAVELSPSPPPPQTQIQPKLSLIKPSEYNKIEEKSEKINEENAAEEEEENSTNTEDEAEEEDDEEETKPTHEILTNWSIPSKPEILYFVKKGTYIYECVKNEENPKGEINWTNSVGLVMGAKIVYTMSYKHYESLIVRT